MTSNEIITCTIYEKNIVTQNGKEIEVFKLVDTVLCLYNPIYDNYIHMSGTFLNQKTNKEFNNKDCNYVIYPFDVTEVAEYIPTLYDIKNIIKEINEGFKYAYMNEFGDITRIKDEKLLKLAKEVFNKNKLEYFKLDEYSLISAADDVLRNNINKLKENTNILERQNFIDEELDRYNNFMKRKKISN